MESDRVIQEGPSHQDAFEETFLFMIERAAICYLIYFLSLSQFDKSSQPLDYYLLRFGALFLVMMFSFARKFRVTEYGLIHATEKVAFIVLCFGIRYSSCFYVGVVFFFVTNTFFFESFYLKHLHRIRYFVQLRQKLPVQADYISKSMAIEHIRAIEATLFKIERIVIFFITFLANHLPQHLNSAIMILIFTNVLYLVLDLQREKIPYNQDPDYIFFLERIGFFFFLLFQESRYECPIFGDIVLGIGGGIFIVTNTIMIIQKVNHNHKETSETKEKNVHDKELKKSDGAMNQDHDHDQNCSNEMEGVSEKVMKMLIDGRIRENKLEEENKKMSVRLETANEIVEYYQDIVRGFAEQSVAWEEERKVLSTKLEAASSNASAYYANMMAFSHEMNNQNLFSTIKVSLEELDKTCQNMRQEISNLTNELIEEIASGERSRVALKEMEEKCKRLEKEKREIASKILQEVDAEVYYKFLHGYYYDMTDF